MKTKPDHIVSRGNVFADLNVKRPDEVLAKAELAHRIVAVLTKRKLTQSDAAKILKLDQPKVSALVRGRLSGFSIERLLRLLVLLGHDVEINIRSRSRSRNRARLLVA
jgi:predicted XRE-type DNA-binding protein